MGYFYSPIVSKLDIEGFENQIWEEQNGNTIESVDLNTDVQLQLVKEFENYYTELPFSEQKTDTTRYYLDNSSYAYTDGIVLYSMIRHFRPKRIIEIGSGYSSAIMLDTKELFNPEMEITFIDPYPKKLYGTFKESDTSSCTVLDKKVQSVSLDVFEKLGANDILFIDSSHVSKTGSDVNYELFKIFPVLQSGVIIHVHDIFHPFEYPKEWVYDGRNWNEAYLLRAFLSHNPDYEILLFSHYLHTRHPDIFKNMPLAYKNQGGNLWIRKK